MNAKIQITDFSIGDGNLVLIAGPCVIESAAATLEIARTLKEICRGTGPAADLQGLLRQGQPHLPVVLPGAGAGAGAGDSGPGQGRGGAAGTIRRPPGRRRGARRRSPGRPADSRLPLPPDRPGGGRGPDRQGGEYQEGPVPGPLGYAAGGGKGPGRRQ